MKTALFEDGLFSRKGEAQPAIQAAIEPQRPNRFEMLARGLGVDTGPASADEADQTDATVTALRPHPAHAEDAEAETPDPQARRDDEGAAAVAPDPSSDLATARRPKARARPPWVRLVFSADGPKQGPDPRTLDPDGLVEDMPAFGLGPDQDAQEDRRRRRVSVRLPQREHALLRQFSQVCGQTLQDIVRRSILTYMIGDLTRRLDDDPASGGDSEKR